MTMLDEESSPGAGLWSTTGITTPSPTSQVRFSVADETAVGRVPTRNLKPIAQAAKSRNCGPRTCPRCKFCKYCPCARCCCPCTCCHFFSWFCAIIVLVLLAIGIVVLVFWKVLHPKLPTYDVDNVQFQYNVTGSGSTGAGSSSGPSSYVLSSETTFTIILGNPNTKIGIYYDQIKLQILMFGLIIGNQIIPKFYDGYGVTKNINGDLKSGNVTLSAASQASLTAAQSIGKVPLNLDVDVKVRAKVGYLVTPQLKVGLRCLLTLDPGISSGSQITDRVACKFKLML